MSKAALLKELGAMTKEQIVDIVIDAYQRKKEVKEYFEFFLNPDVEKLLEKQFLIAAKEWNRSKHRRCKARVSNIRKAIKDLDSYDIETEYKILLRQRVFLYGLAAIATLYFTETQNNFLKKLLSEIIVMTDRVGQFDKFITDIVPSIDRMRGDNYLRNELLEIVDNASSLINPIEK